MGKHKHPETQKEWEEEISFQLLNLARNRTMTVGEITKLHDVIRDLAKIHGIQISRPRVYGQPEPEPEPEPEEVKVVEVAPEPGKKPLTKPFGTSILDEMGGR